jgi:putative nucleotidyltransferase with HDIG domain
VKRVLFVDDEAPVLEGLRTRLHRFHTKWDMEFFQSGALALARVQEHPCDVIVTDMRMPGMDGARLLGTVRERWPQIIRIVLSGYAELDQTVRLVPFAHQYLSKPCQPKQLENVIDRCLLLHELLSRPGLRSLVGRVRSLPTLPKIYTALQGIVKDDNITVGEVAKIVGADSALAARVLHVVNSAFFRLARRISNIEQAVGYLGFQAIRNLAMSVEIFSRWPGNNCAGLDVEKLQNHAHAVAAAASALAAKTGLADDALLAGLLHDIGYWVLAQECPRDLSQAATLAMGRGIPLHEAETEVLGASHAEIGAYLLGIWGLPHSVVEAVAHHHRHDRVVHTDFDVLSALVIADSLVAADDSSFFTPGMPRDPRLDSSYLRTVNAPFDWDEAVRRVAAINDTEEVCR